MTSPTDNELLADLRAKRDWLRGNPGGMAASTTKRRIREIERELEARGVRVETDVGSRHAQLGRSVWYVVDTRETAGNRCLHAERTCMHLDESTLREATDYERDHLPVCSTCG